MLKQRVLTALVLLLIVLGALFLAPAWVWGAFSLVAMALAAREWGRLVTGPRGATVLAVGLVVAGGAWLLWRGPGSVGPIALMLTTGLLAIDLLAWLGHALPAVLRARLPRDPLPARIASNEGAAGGVRPRAMRPSRPMPPRTMPPWAMPPRAMDRPRRRRRRWPSPRCRSSASGSRCTNCA